MSPVNCGVGLPDDTPINPKPGRSTDTSPRQETQGCSVFGSAGTRVRAACSPFTGWPAPPSNAISKSKGPQIPMTRATPNTSRSATTLSGAYAEMEGFLVPSTLPRQEWRRRLTQVHRANDVEVPAHVDIVLYEPGLPCPADA